MYPSVHKILKTVHTCLANHHHTENKEEMNFQSYQGSTAAPVPNTRQQLFQRYIDTCHHCREQIPRNTLAAAQLTDPQHASEDADDVVANGQNAMI